MEIERLALVTGGLELTCPSAEIQPMLSTREARAAM